MKFDAAAPATPAQADRDQLQALINERLAKSQIARGIKPACPGPSTSESTSGYASGVLKKETVRPQGRAFIRSCTADLQEPTQVAAHVADVEAPQLGRIISNRSQSAHASRKTCVSSAPVIKRSENDRPSSVPPPLTTVIMAAVRFKNNVKSRRTQESKSVSASKPAAVNDLEDEEEGQPFPLTTVLMAAVRFARPLTVSGRRFGQLLPKQNALGRDVRRQLRLIVAGLMGSGKSTLCRMLAYLLGGVWVNQDEFSHKGKAAKKAFLEEIEREAQDHKVPVLIVDKINTMRQHRREILDGMQHGASGDVVFIQLVHPRDAPDRLDNMVKLCLSRIQGRGEGHRTLMASNPKLRSILKMTAGGVEQMLPDELCRFSARIHVDVTQQPKQIAMQVLADLDKNELLGRFRLDDLISQERLDDALAEAQSAEKQLGSAAVASVQPKRKAPVWYWTIDFDADAIATLRALWTAQAPNVPDMHEAADLHVTLLYIGGASDKELCSRHCRFQNERDVRGLRERLQGIEGHHVDIQIVAVARDDRIAAAEVSGLDSLCGNDYPHVTLAHRPGIPPRMSNDMLARRAANADFDARLRPWLVQLHLADLETHVRDWCSSAGVATADKVASSAANVVAALRQKNDTYDEDYLATIRQTLSHATAGVVQEAGVAPFKCPLNVRGQIRGRLRGE